MEGAPCKERIRCQDSEVNLRENAAMRSHKAVSDSAPSRCLHRSQANAATRAGAMREDACSIRVETRKASGKWSAWRPMMTWQHRRASTDQPSGMRSYVRRGTDSRP